MDKKDIVSIIMGILLIAVGIFCFQQRAYINDMPMQLSYALNPLDQEIIFFQRFGESYDDFQRRAALVHSDLKNRKCEIRYCEYDPKGTSMRIIYSGGSDARKSWGEFLDSAQKKKLVINKWKDGDDQLTARLKKEVSLLKEQGNYFIEVEFEVGDNPKEMTIYYKKKGPPEWFKEPEPVLP